MPRYELTAEENELFLGRLNAEGIFFEICARDETFRRFLVPEKIKELRPWVSFRRHTFIKDELAIWRCFRDGKVTELDTITAITHLMEAYYDHKFLWGQAIN